MISNKNEKGFKFVFLLCFDSETPASLQSFLVICMLKQFWYIKRNVCCFVNPFRVALNKSNQVCVSVPDFWHHEAMLDHECVTDGSHHGENLLAGWIPPHQVQQGVSLMLGVQLVDTLLCDQLHGDPGVILTEKERRRLEDWKNRSSFPS